MGGFKSIAKSVTKIGQGLGNALTQFGDWYSGKDAIKYQNELNRENWEMQNAYNTPSAQMARYKEAGLNPNLIYGQSNTAGAISAPGMMESGSSQIDKAAGTIASFFSAKAMLAEIANKKKQNSLLQSQADYVDEQTKGVALENKLKKIGIDSLRGDNPFEANPNDTYWYRDIKKGLQWLGKQVVNARSAYSQVEQRYNSSGLPAWLDPRSYRRAMREFESSQNKVKWHRKDKGGR